MTADMTIPLTAVWAARQLYSKQQLASMQEFNLHLVGAAHFEFDHVSAVSLRQAPAGHSSWQPLLQQAKQPHPLPDAQGTALVCSSNCSFVCNWLAAVDCSSDLFSSSAGADTPHSLVAAYVLSSVAPSGGGQHCC